MVTFQRMVENPSSPPDARPLKVLHVVSGDLWAGAEVQVWQLLRAANAVENLDIYAVVLNAGQLAERLKADGVRVTVFDENEWSFFALARAVRKLAEQWQPAVIHTHRRKEHLLGAVAARACGAALVGTVHGRPEFSHSRLNFRQRALHSLENTILARVHDRLVAVSDDLADELPGGRRHAVVIPNSVDVEVVRAAAQAPPRELQQQDRIPIGFLGRLVPVKQVDRMLEMMTVLESERPGAFILHIVGDGPLRARLQDKAQRMGVDDAVVFHGFMPNPLPVLARMRAFLFASEHEGLPMTALEALALGVPLVCPPIGSLSRLIEESGAGCVATSSAPRDLADALLGLELKTDVSEGLQPSRLPQRYHIDQGLSATVGLWRQLARRQL